MFEYLYGRREGGKEGGRERKKEEERREKSGLIDIPPFACYLLFAVLNTFLFYIL